MNPNPHVSIRNINLEHKYGSTERFCAHNGADKAKKFFLKLHGLHRVLLEYHSIHTALRIVVYQPCLTALITYDYHWTETNPHDGSGQNVGISHDGFIRQFCVEKSVSRVADMWHPYLSAAQMCSGAMESYIVIGERWKRNFCRRPVMGCQFTRSNYISGTIWVHTHVQ